jgi:hypothetical protein
VLDTFNPTPPSLKRGPTERGLTVRMNSLLVSTSSWYTTQRGNTSLDRLLPGWMCTVVGFWGWTGVKVEANDQHTRQQSQLGRRNACLSKLSWTGV